MGNSGKQTLESMSQAVWYNQWTLNKFKLYLKGKILEVGCGIGNFTKTLTDFGQVWAIDIDKNYIKQTQNKVSDKAKVGLGDIEKGRYFFNNPKFDAEICINVLEHIKDDRKALRNLYTLLDDDGYLILLIPAHRFLYGKIDQAIGHFRRYTKEDIKEKLRKVGFKIISCKRLNFIGGVGWFLANKVFSERSVSDTKIEIFNLLAPFILPLENLIEPPIGTSILIIAQKND